MNLRRSICFRHVAMIGMVWLFCAWGGVSRGQSADMLPESDDLMARPSEFGIRFTPEMARAIGSRLVTEVLARRYEIDESQIDQATKAITRCLMKAANACDNDEHLASIEQMIGDCLQAEADPDPNKVGPGMSPKTAMAIGKHMTMASPVVRELVRNVGQDLMPMLPIRQQLKLGADLITVGTALDAFESNMERWAEGRAKPFEDPFKPQDAEPVKDEQGQSEIMKRAQKEAHAIDVEKLTSIWERYVEDAKEFYEFNEPQASTADSVLREFIQRAQAVASDESRRRHIYQNRLWNGLIWRLLRLGPNHPLRHLLDRDYVKLVKPVHELTDEFKLEIDKIPTGAQRKAAQARINAALAEQGYGLDDEEK